MATGAGLFEIAGLEQPKLVIPAFVDEGSAPTFLRLKGVDITSVPQNALVLLDKGALGIGSPPYLTMLSLNYPDVILRDRPVLYYRMDTVEGNIVRDISGNGNDGVIHGGVTLAQPGATADGDYAMKLDGSTGYIQTPLVEESVTAYSIECWMNTTSSAVQGITQNRLDADGSTSGHSLTMAVGSWVVGPAGVVSFIDDSNYIYIGNYTNSTYNDGRWHHVVGVWSAPQGAAIVPSQFLIYIDGALVSVTAANNFIFDASPLTGGTAGRAIGAAWTYVSPSAFFNGLLDEIAVYNYALSAAQVAAHYNAAKTPVLPQLLPNIPKPNTRAWIIIPDTPTISDIFTGAIRVPVTNYRTEVIGNVTVPPTAIQYIASGDEYACEYMTILGRENVAGTLKCNDITIQGGGRLVVWPGGEVVMGAF